jgi:predicted DNA binding CopG/RHH family protein
MTKKTDQVDDAELLKAYESRRLKSVASPEEIARFRSAARATALKDRRVNIRLSSVDLGDIQVKALEQGLPYQTLIASVLHKYVTGRLVERSDAAVEEPPPKPYGRTRRT